jgi:predicted Zn-dependent protease with MMP-like domain
MKNNFEQLVALAEKEVRRTLDSLPAPLRAAAQDVTLAFEDMPDEELVAEGFDPGTLGLFTGPDRAEHTGAQHPYPPQITLFIENLYLFAGYDLDVFVEEVRTTYLHELGHYLGLSEDEIADRGLE